MTNIKGIIFLIAETVFLTVAGLVLSLFQLSNWINLIIYILILAEVVFSIGFSYKNYDIKSNNVNVTAFVLAFILFCSCEVAVSVIQIPTACVTSYFFSLAYLIAEGCFQVFKRNKSDRKSWPAVVRVIGAIMFILCITMGFANLFGLVTHK